MALFSLVGFCLTFKDVEWEADYTTNELQTGSTCIFCVFKVWGAQIHPPKNQATVPGRHMFFKFKRSEGKGWISRKVSMDFSMMDDFFCFIFLEVLSQVDWQGSLNYRPKQGTFIREFPEHYPVLELFDPLKIDPWLVPSSSTLQGTRPIMSHVWWHSPCRYPPAEPCKSLKIKELKYQSKAVTKWWKHLGKTGMVLQHIQVPKMEESSCIISCI